MRRFAALVLGCAVVMTACGCTPINTEPASGEAEANTTAPETDTVAAPSSVTSTTAVIDAIEEPVPDWYLVSVTAALPDGFSQDLALIDGVQIVSTVNVGTVDLVESRSPGGAIVDDAPTGYVLPLEAHVIDAVSHAEFVPLPIARMLDGLDDGEAILSRSSATFRRLDKGSLMVLEDGTELTVIGVVADEWVGAAEIVLASGDAGRLGIVSGRYSVALYDGSRADLERLANDLTDAPVRVRSRDEVDVFRHADAVAAQIAIKARFGEFAYRPLGGGKIEIDPAWKDRHIVRERLPLLGIVTCHVEFVEMLREALGTLQAAGHDDAIDHSAYAGCWNPRLIRERTDLSRHAWGVAADINFWNSADGTAGAPEDPHLIDAMEAVGVLSGHAWTDPGPGHFEWYGPVGATPRNPYLCLFDEFPRVSHRGKPLLASCRD